MCPLALFRQRAKPRPFSRGNYRLLKDHIFTMREPLSTRYYEVRVACYICGPSLSPSFARCPATHVFMHFHRLAAPWARIHAYMRAEITSKTRVNRPYSLRTVKKNNIVEIGVAKCLNFLESGVSKRKCMREMWGINSKRNYSCNSIIKSNFSWIRNRLSWFLPDTRGFVVREPYLFIAFNSDSLTVWFTRRRRTWKLVMGIYWRRRLP